MTRSRPSLALAALACAGLSLPAAAQPKPAFSQIDVKAAVKKAVDASLVSFKSQFPVLKLVNPCTAEFNAAVAAAHSGLSACLDANNPPAGSPLADFNALSNVALATKCANKTLDACVAEVVAQQSLFCNKQAAINVAKAKSVLQRCCAPLSQQKVALEKQLADITADLQSCLAK